MSTPAPAKPAVPPAQQPLASTIVPAGAAPQTTVVLAPGAAVPVPSYLLDDADALYAANTLGLGKDLGLEPKPATPPAATSNPPAAAPGSQEPPAGAAAPVNPPANETPEQKVLRLEAELKALKEGKILPAEDLAKAGEELQAGKGSPAATPALPVVVPTPDNPLANYRSAEQFKVAEDAARELKAWAFANRDGGELPAHIAQLAENAEAARMGRQPAKITGPATIDAATAANLHNNAELMLDKYLPARKQAVGTEQQLIQAVAKDDPELFNPKTEKGQLVQRMIAAFPHLTQAPEWPLIVQDTVVGYQARMAKAAAAAKTPTEVQAAAQAKADADAKAAAAAARPNVQDEQGNVIPFAGGGAPTGGGAPAASSLSQKAIDEANARARAGKATDEDWIILGSAAV